MTYLTFAYAQQQNDHITIIPSTHIKLKEIGSLPKTIREASGLEMTSGKYLWTHNDDGVPVLFCLDTLGKLIRTLHLNHLNSGWEDLTLDEKGALYIGGFGNNKNDKKPLRIYKVENPDSVSEKIYSASIINYSYKDQTAFPPPNHLKNFDVDAMVSIGDSLYLFSKNRTTPFTGYSRVYALSQKPGDHQAITVDSIFLGNGPMMKFWVTGADLSPDGTTLALLSHDCIWFIKNFKGKHFSSGKIYRLELNHFSHKAGLCFASNEKIYIVDELEMDIIGGKLYLLDISTLKSLLK